jgi:c-di-GMP-binding flagellar brake protein YcgR
MGPTGPGTGEGGAVVTGTVDWPALNTLVTCAGAGWDGEIASRVEDTDGSTLVLAAPLDPGDPVPRLLRPAPASVVRVRWTHPRGMSELRCEVRRVDLRPTPQWEVRPLEPADHIQRREAVRVFVLLHLELRLDEGTFRATTVDVSEGGVRCVVPAKDHFAPGERVDMLLHVGGEPIAATAELLRCRQSNGGSTEVTARFLGMDKRDADRVRKFLFAEQVALRARQRDLD